MQAKINNLPTCASTGILAKCRPKGVSVFALSSAFKSSKLLRAVLTASMEGGVSI
jgi:hypothetical protein